MAKDKFAQWLNLNKALQTVADTLISSETIIPTSPEEGKVIAVHAIEFMVGMLQAVDECWVAPFIATRPDLTLAQLMPGSPYLIDWCEKEVTMATSGLGIFNVNERHVFPMPFLIAHPKLYLYATSSQTGTVQTVRARILFTFEKVSTQEYFEALAQFGA